MFSLPRLGSMLSKRDIAVKERYRTSKINALSIVNRAEYGRGNEVLQKVLQVFI